MSVVSIDATWASATQRGNQPHQTEEFMHAATQLAPRRSATTGEADHG